jgi:arsenate reductase
LPCDNAKESCPIFPGHGERIHHSFEDPAAMPADSQPDVFRRVRKELEDWLREFASEKRLID